MTEPVVADVTDPPSPEHPPVVVVWLLRTTLVYAAVELVALVVHLTIAPEVWILIVTLVGPALRVALGVATYRGRRAARVAAIVLDVLGSGLGVLALVVLGSPRPPGSALAEYAVRVVGVLLVIALLVLTAHRATGRWCALVSARCRGEDPETIGLPSGAGTSRLTVRRGDGPPGERPLIVVPEEQSPTTSTGPGTRGCRMCERRWHSHAADLADAGRFDERPDAEVEAVVTWRGLVGLTCPWCGAVCRDHMIRLGVGNGSRAEARCPSCSGPLVPA